MNIILPMVGLGQRFKNEGYIMPKPLINVLGKPMLYRVIDSLNVDVNTDKIYIVYHSILKEYNFEYLIKNYFPKHNINFICVDYLTKGAAETVLCCLDTFSPKELNENILLFDCDTFYEDDVITKYKSSLKKNLIFYFNDINVNPIYSYIKLENNKVIQIKEKEKLSNNANTGGYGFENGNVLKKYCKAVLDLSGELYISKVYDLMLENKEEIYSEKIENFNCVGTPLQLKVYCNERKNKSEKLRICFDLDNTLVTHPVKSKDYTSVLPIKQNINYLKYLKSLGHTIIIYTARRMKTHSGNIGAVTADIASITIDTLKKYEIPFDELYFGKPYADFYIDDLALTPNSSLEMGLGIYNTDTMPRYFNKVEYQDNIIIKHTINDGEIFWYKHIPKNVEYLFPKVLEIQNNIIKLERIRGVNYSYLFVNGLLTIEDLDKLIESLKYLHNTEYVQESYKEMYSNYSAKILDRQNEYTELYSKYDLHSVIKLISKKLLEYENNNDGRCGVIHGDAVFTNILKTSHGIKFIDMRGKQGNLLTLLGDIYYDYAKLYQSLIGYDYILDDKEFNSEYMNKLISYYESKFTEKELKNIKLITASLFLSLMPLHSEDSYKFKKYIKIIKNLIKTII